MIVKINDKEYFIFAQRENEEVVIKGISKDKEIITITEEIIYGRK